MVGLTIFIVICVAIMGVLNISSGVWLLGSVRGVHTIPYKHRIFTTQATRNGAMCRIF